MDGRHLLQRRPGRRGSGVLRHQPAHGADLARTDGRPLALCRTGGERVPGPPVPPAGLPRARTRPRALRDPGLHPPRPHRGDRRVAGRRSAGRVSPRTISRSATAAPSCCAVAATALSARPSRRCAPAACAGPRMPLPRSSSRPTASSAGTVVSPTTASRSGARSRAAMFDRIVPTTEFDAGSGSEEMTRDAGRSQAGTSAKTE